MVRVVLHERSPTGEITRDHLHGSEQCSRLPIALGAETEAIRHQPLYSQPGKLAQSVQILKRGGEPLESAFLQEGTQPQFDPGAISEGLVTRATLAERLRDDITIGIFIAEFVDLTIVNADI